MQTVTIILILVAAFVSLAIVYLQYLHKSKRSARLNRWLAACRFVAVFSLLLLLINPEFIKRQFELEKVNLVVLLDNSASVAVTGGDTQTVEVAKTIAGDKALSEKFKISTYTFGEELNRYDSLSFRDKTTNITNALSSLSEIHSNSPTAIVLATDGNQTLGEDYEFYARNKTQPIYPLVVGDTTRHTDIAIDQLNTNTYAFLGNQFPIEVYLSYTGTAPVSSDLTISVDGKAVYREKLELSQESASRTIRTLTTALSVGVKRVKVSVAPINGERNTANNSRTAAVEVIDEKTEVAIISELRHPDLGALKKAIEMNEQRTVRILAPDTPFSEVEGVDVFILYQPSAGFREIYPFIEQKKASKFTITGTKTDWNFLNSIQSSFEKNSAVQTEEVSALLNPGFSLFDVSDFDITDFPPLEDELGDLLITKISETILGQQIKGMATQEPLLTLIEEGTRKEAVLFGENIWKWRAQSYRNDRDFSNFDDMIGKLLLYLSTNDARSRLSLEYDRIYRGDSEAFITASYFDKSFLFDGDANISLYLKNDSTGLRMEIPMLLMNGYYKADLDQLAPGTYQFDVKVQQDNLSKSGEFTILDYEVEKQLASSDYRKLERLAATSGSRLYFPSQAGRLIEDLLADPRYVPIQKSNQNIVPLIDFNILLAIIIAALTAEWFIRKYNGLI